MRNMIIVAIADHSVQFRQELERHLKNGQFEVEVNTSNGSPFLEGLRKSARATVALINYLPASPFTLNTATAARQLFPEVKIIITASQIHTGLYRQIVDTGYEGLWEKDRSAIQILFSMIRLVHNGYKCFPALDG